MAENPDFSGSPFINSKTLGVGPNRLLRTQTKVTRNKRHEVQRPGLGGRARSPGSWIPASRAHAARETLISPLLQSPRHFLGTWGILVSRHYGIRRRKLDFEHYPLVRQFSFHGKRDLQFAGKWA